MKRILVIEDNPIVAKVVIALLAKQYAVKWAGNGREGLALLSAESFDLVITDLLMPEMEGLETIRALRGQFPGIPILAMTGGSRFGSPGDLLHMAQDFGAARTLRKPIQPGELYEKVSECLALSAGEASDGPGWSQIDRP